MPESEGGHGGATWPEAVAVGRGPGGGRDSPPGLPTARGRVRWLRVGSAAVLLAALAAVGWWLAPRWAPAAGSPLVGTWRVESATPVFPARPELVVEFDLLADG